MIRFERISSWIGGMACVLLALPSPVSAGNISLAWTAVPGAAGYKVYYGESSGAYSHVVDMGNALEGNLDDLDDCRDYFVAIKAYNPLGESAAFSNEVSGWPRPEMNSLDPGHVRQGSRLTIDIRGNNFAPGAEVSFDGSDLPTDIDGNPLVRIDSVSVLSCTEIQAMLTIEPTVRGFRAMEVGDCVMGLEVRNLDRVFGSGFAVFDVLFDPSRSDINRTDGSTRDRVDGKDLVWLTHAYGTREGDPSFNADADLNGDGLVDGEDLAYLAEVFGACWGGSGWSADACL